MGEQLLCDMQVVLKAINESGGQDFAARDAWVDLLVERYGERPIKPGWQSLAAGLRWLNDTRKTPLKTGGAFGWLSWWLPLKTFKSNDVEDTTMRAWFNKNYSTPAHALLHGAREWAKPEYSHLRTA